MSAVTLSSVNFSGTYASTVTLTTDLLVSSSVISAVSATGHLDLNGHRIAIGSDLTADGLTFFSSVAGSTVEFNGSSYGVASKSPGPLRFENVEFNKTNSTLTVTSDLIVTSTFSVFGGTVIVQGARIDLTGDFFLNGYLDVRTSTLALVGSTPQQLGGDVNAVVTSFAGLYI